MISGVLQSETDSQLNNLVAGALGYALSATSGKGSLLLSAVQLLTFEESMERNEVTTKADFVRRYQAGEFGNASPTWNTFEEFQIFTKEKYPTLADVVGTQDKYHLRNRVVGGTTHYNLNPRIAFGDWFEFVLKGEDKQWYCSQMAPTHLTTIQGEVQRTYRGLELFYSTVKKPMRDSLREGGKQVYGVSASAILRDYLPTKDHEWLMGLLEKYPDHVVEFSTFSREFGTVPGFKTVYWEVRKY